MSDDILLWPHRLLKPATVLANPVPFTRGGGRSLGGLQRTTRTDRGWWSIAYKGISLDSAAKRQQWNRIRVALGGQAGLIAIPVWSYDTLPWPAGAVQGEMLTPHSDGSGFSDGSSYAQPAFDVVMAAAAAIGDTSVTVRAVSAIADFTGVRFSYNHALYELGVASTIAGDTWTMSVFPAVRAAIPEGAALECGMPTCLVHLAGDREMDVSHDVGKIDKVGVGFVEAVDYWNDLAAS